MNGRKHILIFLYFFVLPLQAMYGGADLLVGQLPRTDTGEAMGLKFWPGSAFQKKS